MSTAPQFEIAPKQVDTTGRLWTPEVIDNPDGIIRNESIFDIHKVELFNGRFKYDVLFVDSDDYRVEEARRIEVEAMTELGDPAEEVIEEFLPYNPHSFFLLAYKDGTDHTPENLEGMMRIIPQRPGIEQKTLSDLSYILHKQKTDLGQLGDVSVEEYQERVTQAFMSQSGCQDMDKIWDVATFAPRGEFDRAQRGVVAMALISALTENALEAHKQGYLEYCLVFNEQNFHNFAVNTLKFPYHILRDEQDREIGPVMYDTFDSGVGMVAIPAFLRMSEINEILTRPKRENANLRLGRIVLQSS